METWIAITLGAVVLQNLRTALQGRQARVLSVTGATYARYVFALPPAAVYLLLLSVLTGDALPPLNGAFLWQVAVGGGTQILATAALLGSFAARGFAAGTALSKTEVLQTALFGALLLGELPGPGALAAIFLSFIGVWLLLRPAEGFAGRGGWMLGLAAGGLFGLSAVCYRGAALALGGGESAWLPAAMTLAVSVALQGLIMTLYLALWNRGEIGRVLAGWRGTLPVSLTGVLGSICWFTAMTLQSAVYVRALGQAELLLAFATARLFFGEATRPIEALGALLLAVGILLLLLG